jgi:hypothetical protein
VVIDNRVREYRQKKVNECRTKIIAEEAMHAIDIFNVHRCNVGVEPFAVAAGTGS